MRKLLYYFTPQFWYGVIVVALIIFMVAGCAGISLKAPTTQMLIKDAIYIAAYTMGQENPVLATEFIEHTYVDREDILTLYPSWKRYLAYRVKDPVHRRLVISMLSLVDIELYLKPSEEQEEIIRTLFREFIAGLQAGIDSR